MPIDLLAGAAIRPCPPGLARPTILVFDSGLGGLTVLRELQRIRPEAAFIYAADDAAFPYGGWAEPDLVERVCFVIGRLLSLHDPDLVVIACNTASTLVLPALRARFEAPFVGTVPAVKPAAALSSSGLISVLGTPGTVARDYTHGLVRTYAGRCEVKLVGSRLLAGYAESELAGDPVPDEAVAAEIAPCFVERAGARTDAVALACTHYPLLLERFRRLAPWPVAWIDPAPAIARQASRILGDPAESSPGIGPVPETLAIFTGRRGLSPALSAALAARGLDRVAQDACPLPPRS